jgi:hypothetical protein
MDVKKCELQWNRWEHLSTTEPLFENASAHTAIHAKKRKNDNDLKLVPESEPIVCLILVSLSNMGQWWALRHAKLAKKGKTGPPC